MNQMGWLSQTLLAPGARKPEGLSQNSYGQLCWWVSGGSGASSTMVSVTVLATALPGGVAVLGAGGAGRLRLLAATAAGGGGRR